MRSISTRFAGAIAAVLAAALTASLSVTPAEAASSQGLYGAQDPTYDGVFRQSLAIIALRSHGIAVPAAAQRWLLNQQCADGSFEAFRSDTSAPCKEADLEMYSGKDTNSTALGALGLFALGKKSQAKKAVAWLRAAQNADGGLPWLKGLDSDAASTALTMFAARSVGATTFSRNGRTMVGYLRTTVLGCGADVTKRGAVSFQKTTPLVASDLTTAQVAAALSATLPIAPQARSSANVSLKCPGGVPSTHAGLKDVMASYLSQRLADNRFQIPSAFGSGVDWSSTSWSVLALLGARRGLSEATKTVQQLRINVRDVVRGSDNTIEPGKTALLLLVVRAVNEKPTNFGGVNLLKSLQGSLR